MARMGFAPIVKEVFFHDDVFPITEEAVGRALTSEERRILQDLFSLTIVAYDMTAGAPAAAGVRKCLDKISHPKNDAEFLSLTCAEASYKIRLGNIRIGPDVAFADLWRARDMLTNSLNRRGLCLSTAAPDVIKEEAKLLAEILKRRTHPGRSRDHVAAGMLWGLADFAEMIGMTPSASFKPAKRRRDSPFLRWLKELACLMPDRVGKPFRKGLEERARHVLAIRKKSGVRNDFSFDEIPPLSEW